MPDYQQQLISEMLWDKGIAQNVEKSWKQKLCLIIRMLSLEESGLKDAGLLILKKMVGVDIKGLHLKCQRTS